MSHRGGSTEGGTAGNQDWRRNWRKTWESSLWLIQGWGKQGGRERSREKGDRGGGEELGGRVEVEADWGGERGRGRLE